MARFEVPEGWCVQAFRFTLDPTEDQARALARPFVVRRKACFLSTSDAADEGLGVGVGLRRVVNII